MKPTIYLLLTVILCSQWVKGQQTLDPFWSHKFSVVSNIPYGEDPAQRLDLYLQGEYIGEPHYFKPAPTPRPTVVYFHGGGWFSGEKETRLGLFMHYLERGWQVVNVEYRLGKNTAPNALTDAKTVLYWLGTHGEKFNVDFDNIVLSGESAGGHLALYTGFEYTKQENAPLHIKGIINWFGAVDLCALDTYYGDNPMNYLRLWTGSETAAKEKCEALSVTAVLHQKVPPVLSIHGTEDTVVPFDQAELLHQKLENLGVTNQLLPQKGGKHMGFSNTQFQAIQSEIFQFLGQLN
jgi:acetyl esterase/lipase